MQNTVLNFILFLLSNYLHFNSVNYVIMKFVSKTSPQYVLQSEMGKSNTQYSSIFKVTGNYTAGCVTFKKSTTSPGFSRNAND